MFEISKSSIYYDLSSFTDIIKGPCTSDEVFHVLDMENS